MPKKPRKRSRRATEKRRHSRPLYVMTTDAKFRSWQNKARTSGMSLREWVTRGLDSTPVFHVEVTSKEP